MGVMEALMGLSTALQMGSEYQQGKAQRKAYEAQAEAAQQNAAAVAAQRSQMADSYAQKQKELRDRMKLAAGQANAAAGASGMTADGSVADVLGAGEEQFVTDSKNLLQQQRNDSWSRYTEEVNYRNQANAARTAAKNVKRQTTLNMLGTLASGAASIYGSSKGLNTKKTPKLGE